MENWTLTAFDRIAAENGDVSPAVRTGAIVLKLVAVAVIHELEATTDGSAAENETEPAAVGCHNRRTEERLALINYPTDRQ